MNIGWHPGAVEEFLNLEQQLQKKVNAEIEKLPEEGLKWEKVGLVNRPEISLSCYRLKLAEEGSNLNHRVLFKVIDNSYLILKLGKRPDFYDLENLEEAKKRLE